MDAGVRVATEQVGLELDQTMQNCIIHELDLHQSWHRVKTHSNRKALHYIRRTKIW